TSPHLADDVDGDAHRPGGQAALATELRQPSQEPECRLLGRLARQLGIAQEAQAQAIPQVLQLAQQRLAGGSITGFGAAKRWLVHASCSCGRKVSVKPGATV